MKKQLWILLCLLPLALSAQKNIFQWQPARYDATETLAAELEYWEIFQINPLEMSRLARQYPQGADMSWQWPSGEVTFQLFADDIRASGYRSAELSAGGVRELPAGPNITYGGQVAGGGNMRLTLHDDFIFGYWEKDGQIWFVQPLRHFVPSAPEHHFVIYKTSDVKPVPNAHCGWTHAEQHRKQHAEDVQHAKMAGECYQVEIAIASDFLMFQFFGTVGAVQDFTIGVLNTVQTNYDNDFADEIRFLIVANMVSSCATCDPWTASTVSNELLVSFRAWGNGGGFGVNYDVASLWSDRDFNGNTIGLAWVGALCSGSRYNILERFTSNSAFLRNLQAHELGHNFDADHDATGSPTIMAPSVNGSNNWSALSVSVINNYITFIAGQGDCFSECGGSQPLAPTAQIQLPVTHVCPGSVVPLIDNSAGTPTSWNWGLSGATPPSSFLQSPTVTYDNPGTYPVVLTVSNAIGSDTQFSNTDIVVDENGQKFLLYETFENPILYWDIVNPDNGITWDVREVGGSPYGNKAAYINSAGYSGSGQVDGMISPSFSLSGVSNPVLKIDYAYRRRTSSGSEQLRVKVSTNGGATFPNTIFTGQENGSGNFATGGVLGSAFTPASASDWCYTGNPGSATCIQLNLAQFIGSNDVRILIESVNAGNNNLYVDNVRVEVDCQAALPPVAAIGAQPVSGCAPLTVSFQDNSTGIVDSRAWSFPGGSPSTSSNPFPVVTYHQPGTYNVILEVFNGAGSSFLVQPDLIQVLSAPVTDFSFSANGNTIQFTNTSQGQGSVIWNFGDGQTSIQNNPAHTYAQPGTYTVRLTTANACGETVKERSITIAPPPVAAFSTMQQSGCAPALVQFSNTSTGNPTTYTWSFPGGTPAASTLSSPSVSYPQPGAYTATLIVSNAAGADTISQMLTVGGLPMAGFGVNYMIGETSAAFSNQSTQADSVRWQAAGQTSTADSVVFEFSEDGIYTVQLIAFNHCGNDTSSQTITIVTPPAAGFSADAGTGCAPAEVVFENQSSQNATAFAWSFPGGTPAESSEASPSVSYPQPGTYTATLIVSNAAGADTISQVVTVGGLPMAGFGVNYMIGENSAAFSNQSTQADSVRWQA
ncbi:MAG TPA: PKD domain-containing protein, partial [Saprospiraceae bacterium]|nr:PKD domain-containing protein [Saprospiraceae bacterium]